MFKRNNSFILLLLVILTENYSITQSVKNRPSKNAEVANGLFDAVANAKKAGDSLTQSQAHMSMPSVQIRIRKLKDIEKNKEIIQKALKKEQDLKGTHYVFYTAIPYMRLFQDITRELYQIKVGKIGALKQNAFQFIRYSYNDPIYNKYPDITTFLVGELEKNGIIDDNETRVKTILVSTNISFFGNAGLYGESTYEYFVSPQARVRAKKEWLEACLKSFGYSPAEWADKFLDLQELTDSDTGDLFQILIPKDLVNTIGYLSLRQGIPFDIDYLNKLFGVTSFTFRADDKIYKMISDRLAAIKKQWLEKDPKTVQMVQQLIDNVKAGKYHLNPFLDQYESRPSLFKYLNYYQARLLVTNSYLLNPASGILIYRYSTLNEGKEKQYEQELYKLINEMTQSETGKNQTSIVDEL